MQLLCSAYPDKLMSAGDLTTLAMQTLSGSFVNFLLDDYFIFLPLW